MHDRLVVLYFLAFLTLLLLSGFALFWLHTELSIQGVTNYYATKSFFGLLESVTPHLFGMGIVIFVLTHFFAIIQGVKQQNYQTMTLLLFGVMVLANISGFFVSEQTMVFSLVKLLSTLLFIGFSLLLIQKLLRYI